jgi:hypothetical protein
LLRLLTEEAGPKKEGKAAVENHFHPV